MVSQAQYYLGYEKCLMLEELRLISMMPNSYD